MAEEIKLIFSAGGGMEWKFPKDAKQVSRKEAYTLLGMVRYAQNVLLNMLAQPVEENNEPK